MKYYKNYLQFRLQNMVVSYDGVTIHQFELDLRII